jgi:hypothetical protein
MHTKGDIERSLLCCAHVNKHQSKYEETFGGIERKFRNLKIPICILLSLCRNCRPHNIYVQIPHKVQKKGSQISPKCPKKPNTLCRCLKCSTINKKEHDK